MALPFFGPVACYWGKQRVRNLECLNELQVRRRYVSANAVILLIQKKPCPNWMGTGVLEVGLLQAESEKVVTVNVMTLFFDCFNILNGRI